MSIFDRSGRASPRQQNNGADPAHAFGSQAQIMEEFRRQNYVPPESAARRAAERAGSVLSSLRERIARPQRSYETDAPVYSAETYDQPAAPDMGWEAAFDPDAAQADPAAAAPSAQDRFEAFRNTVYASPYPRQAYSYRMDGSPLFEELSFTAPPRREAPIQQPVYEEISFTAPAQNVNTYQKPVYEELDLTGRRQAQPPQTAAEMPQENFYQEPSSPNEAYYSQQPESEYFAQQPMPAAVPRQQSALANDFQYFFWSMSILAGAALTLFSFIYACMN